MFSRIKFLTGGFSFSEFRQIFGVFRVAASRASADLEPAVRVRPGVDQISAALLKPSLIARRFVNVDADAFGISAFPVFFDLKIKDAQVAVFFLADDFAHEKGFRLAIRRLKIRNRAFRRFRRLNIRRKAEAESRRYNR